MKNRTKTLLIVTPYFPPEGGGLERYAFEIASRLKSDYKWRIVFLTSAKQYGNDEKYELNGLTVYRLGYRFKFSNTPFSFGWIKKTRRILNEIHPDIINIHTPVPGIGNIVAMLAGNTALIVTYHAGSMRKGKLIYDIPVWFYEHLLLPLLLKRANRVVCSSDFVRLDFLKGYLDKSVTITPGTDTKLFVPAPKLKAAHPTILFVAGLGRAEQYKGLRILIEATKKIQENIHDIRLVVVGDGDMRSEYESQVRRLNLQKTIQFKGKLQGKKLAEEYQKAHVFVLPSVNESFGMVILEAMSCGLPVVASNIGGIRLLVEDNKTGFLAEPNNIKDFTNAISKILRDHKLALKFGLAGKNKIVAKFDWNERSLKYNDIFTSFLESRPSIVHISAYYPPHIGGLERVAKTAAELIAKAGYNVRVITSNQDIDNKIIKNKENLTIFSLNSFEFAHTPFAPTLIWHLLRLPKNSIIHLHLSQAFFPELVLLISKLRGIPYVAHFHLDVEPSGSLGFLFVLYKKMFWPPILKSARKVIVCSSEQKIIVEKKFGVQSKNIVVIPNAVSNDFYINRKYKLPEKKLRLLYVGRLSIQKRVERLLEAMSLISIPAHLTIVGDGEDRNKLEIFAKKLQLKNVSFVGAKDNEKIREYHHENDVLLISSDREGGTPLVALEAMAGGLPVIGSDVSGISNFLRGIGVLVTKPYPQNFAKTLERLWYNPIQLIKLSKLSAKKAKGYDWQNFTHQLDNLYKSL